MTQVFTDKQWLEKYERQTQIRCFNLDMWNRYGEQITTLVSESTRHKKRYGVYLYDNEDPTYFIHRLSEKDGKQWELTIHKMNENYGSDEEIGTPQRFDSLAEAVIEIEEYVCAYLELNTVD